jgi:hypothetical protein
MEKENENINWLNILSVYGKLLAETFVFFEKCGRFGNGAVGLHHYDMLKF